MPVSRFDSGLDDGGTGGGQKPELPIIVVCTGRRRSLSLYNPFTGNPVSSHDSSRDNVARELR
jgi:hypothetical protein